MKFYETEKNWKIKIEKKRKVEKKWKTKFEKNEIEKSFLFFNFQSFSSHFNIYAKNEKHFSNFVILEKLFSISISWNWKKLKNDFFEKRFFWKTIFLKNDFFEKRKIEKQKKWFSATPEWSCDENQGWVYNNSVAVSLRLWGQIYSLLRARLEAHRKVYFSSIGHYLKNA